MCQILGVREVIGIAGSDDKCKFVVETLGADKCLNYKNPSFHDDLIKATDGYVDIYFDNVGVRQLLTIMTVNMKILTKSG